MFIDPSKCRPICHSSEPQAPSVHTSNSRLTCLGDRCSAHKLVGSPCLCLPFYGSPSQGDPENTAMQLPYHPNSFGLARDGYVLGPSAALNEIPLQPTISEPAQLQEQGFSVEKLCREKSVDFSTTSMKQVSRLFHVPVPRLKQAPINH